MYKSLLFLILTLLPTISVADGIKVNCTNGLKVVIELEEKVKTFSFFDNYSFSNDLPIVVGKVEISNQTQVEQNISTRGIKGSFNAKEFSRAYKMTIASERIDFDYIQVKPGVKLTLNVYWPVKLPVGTKITSRNFKCDNE